MSSARSASATTSLPKPAALTPAGIGRSTVILSDLEFGTFGPRLCKRRHPTGSRALTQPCQNFQPGIAVGGLHADLLLEGDNRFHGVGAGAAVDAVGFEAVFVEAALDFLDFFERGHALAAGELLAERRIDAHQLAEVQQRQRVAGGCLLYTSPSPRD